MCLHEVITYLKSRRKMRLLDATRTYSALEADCHKAQAAELQACIDGLRAIERRQAKKRITL